MKTLLNNVCDIKSLSADYFAPIEEVTPRIFKYKEDTSGESYIGLIAEELSKIKGYEKMVLRAEDHSITGVNLSILSLGLIYELQKMAKNIYAQKDLDKYIDIQLVAIKNEFDSKIMGLSRDYSAKLNETTQNLATMIAPVTKKIAELEHKIEGLQKKGEIEQEITNINGKIEQISSLLRNEINRMSIEVNNCNSELNTRLRRADVGEILAQVNTTSNNMKHRHDTLDNKFDNIVLDMSKRTDNLGESVRVIDKKIESMCIFSDILRKDSNNIDHKIGLLNEQINMIKNDLGNKSADMNIMNTKISGCILKTSEIEAQASMKRGPYKMSRSITDSISSNDYFNK